jgi:hypothetical protein
MAWLPAMLRKCKRFLEISGRERRDFLSAAAWLPVVSLGLRTFGYRRCCLWLIPKSSGNQELGPADRERAQSIQRMVAAACWVWPLRPTCLTRSLVLVRLLRRRGLPAELKIGVRKPGRRLEAHAWVECGPEVFGASEGGASYRAFEGRIVPSG